MKIKKIILLPLLIIVGVALVVLVVVQWKKHMPTEQEILAEQIIQSFMDSREMDIKPGTEEYKIFMRKIVWGEYPELIGNDSTFVTNKDELDYVLDYAWKHSGYKELYGGYDELDMEEVTPPIESEK